MTRDRERLAAIAAMEQEGLEFYSRASKVASDPRAKDVFLRLAEDKAETLRLFGDRPPKGLGVSATRTMGAGSKAKKIEEAQEVYPRGAIEPLVCFVCGEEVRGTEVPAECPRCGASSYAFEVDIDRGTALEMAIESERRNIDRLRRANRSASGARAKDVIRRLTTLERASLRELETERRKSGG